MHISKLTEETLRHLYLQEKKTETEIADITRNKKVYPLVETTIELALLEGFMHIETLKMPLPTLNRSIGFEPVLVFQKPR